MESRLPLKKRSRLRHEFEDKNLPTKKILRPEENAGHELQADGVLEEENAGDELPAVEEENAGDELQADGVLEEENAGDELPDEVNEPAPQEIAAGVGINSVLIVRKKLERSDVNKGRLTLPIQKSDYNFLSAADLETLQTNRSLEVVVLNTDGDSFNMTMTLHVDGGRSKKLGRVFTKGWRNFVKKNNLEIGDHIEVWKFDVDGSSRYLIREVGQA